MVEGYQNPTMYVRESPQGLILGPTLFLLFINDLPLFMNHCEADFFADDTTLYTNSKNIDAIENNLQADLGNAKLWSEQNKMKINCNKTTGMTVGTKKNV